MEYQAFQEEMLKEMQKRFDHELKLQYMEKLQGRSGTGLSVRPKERTCAAVLNMERHYQLYEMSGSFENAANEVAEEIRYAAAHIPRLEDIDYDDYGSMRQLLVMHLVSASENEEMLGRIPHRIYGDMALVYRFELITGERCSNSLLITDEMLEGYGISEEELHKDALRQAPENHPSVLKTVAEMLEEIAPEQFRAQEVPERECIYTATVKGGVYGAAVIAYPDFLKKAAERIKGDFYILPSSVHEVLLVPDRGIPAAERLNHMVYSVNRQEVSCGDRLSDVAYHYDSAAGLFESAVQFEDRTGRGNPCEI